MHVVGVVPRGREVAEGAHLLAAVDDGGPHHGSQAVGVVLAVPPQASEVLRPLVAHRLQVLLQAGLDGGQAAGPSAHDADTLGHLYLED